jgi:hypothetical protein
MSKGRNVFSLANVEDLLDVRVKKGIVRGAPTGIRALNRKWSLKKGYSTSVFAAAGQGKSIFGLEICMNTSEFDGWKWAVYTPETGTVVEVYIELLWMYHGIKVESQTKAQLQEAKEFVGKHFFVIDFDANDAMRKRAENNNKKEKFDTSDKDIFDPCVNDIYREAFKVEDGLDIKLDGVFIDPFTELSMPNESGVREDVNYGQHLSRCIRYSKRHNIHTIISFHTAKQTTKNFNGISYTDIPHPSEILNGMMTHRKSYMMLSVWVPPVGLPNPMNNGVPFREFETVVTISKVKPKLMGAKGQVSIFYDPERNRYYEEDSSGNKQYACKKNNQPQGYLEPVTEAQIDLVEDITKMQEIAPNDVSEAF